MTKLEYFKNEIIKILDRKEQDEKNISKTLDYKEYLDSLKITMGSIEKSYGVGKTSIYSDGSVWKKISRTPSKWKMIRGPGYVNDNSKNINSSIKKLKNLINECKTSQELMDIILANRNRFIDKSGRLPTIITEIHNEVDNKNNELEKIPENLSPKEISAFSHKLKKRNQKDYGYKRDEHIREDVLLPEKTFYEKLKTKNETIELLEKFKLKPIINKDSNIIANYSGTGINEFVRGSALTKTMEQGFTPNELFTMASHIKELFEEAILISTEPDRDSNIKHPEKDNILGIKRYAIKFNLNGHKGFALLTAKITRLDGNKIYAIGLEALEKNKPGLKIEVE